MPSLLDRPLLYITGKGGVGRSTVAAAVGIAAAARGRRTVIVEIADQSRVTALFDDVPLTATERELQPGLWALTIDPQRVLEDWLVRQIGSRTVVRTMSRSNAFSYFVAAAPGARELVTITKAWELGQPTRWDRAADPFDLVIVDAPASGHGLGVLRTPRTYADVARVGPIRGQADRLATFLADPAKTGYIAVARAEETPVNEALDVETALERDVGATLDLVVVNAVHRRRLSATELRRVEATATADRAARSALDAARAQAGWVRSEQAQVARLRRASQAPVATLPFVATERLDLAAVSRLSRRLVPRLTA